MLSGSDLPRACVRDKISVAHVAIDWFHGSDVSFLRPKYTFIIMLSVTKQLNFVDSC